MKESILIIIVYSLLLLSVSKQTYASGGDTMRKRILSSFFAFIILKSLMPVANAESTPFFLWPTTGKSVYVLDHYVGSGNHTGIDISVIKKPVYAVAGGTVVDMANDCPHYWTTDAGVGHSCGESNSTYGNYVKIEHTIDGKTYTSIYAHLLKDSISVKQGDVVYAGQEIGTSGSSGSSSGPHLHFALFEGKNTEDKRRRSFQYYLNEPDILEGMSFRGLAVDKSEYFQTWIKQNCVLSNDGYYYYDSSNSAVLQYLDQCSSTPCNVILTVTTPGNMKTMPCSQNTNLQSETIEPSPLTIGDTYPSSTQWINPQGSTWYEVTSTTGKRGFIYSGDVSVSPVPSTLSVRDNIVSATTGTPSGTLVQGNNFGLRGIIESNYAITHIEAHIYDSNGNDAVTSYSKDGWNKTSYNIQTDGINNHFSFRSLGNGTYHYVVKASDSFSNEIKVLIDSWFAVGTATPAQQYLDQCTSEPCDVTLTVTTTGNMKSMPCSVNTNAQSTTVESLTSGNTYTSKVRWKNTEGNIWFEVTSTTGQRGFIYIGDVSVTAIIGHGDYYAPSINSTISISGYEAGTPSGTLTQGSNFGLRGIISSDYTITHVEAHIYRSDGTDAVPSYSTSWNSTNYNIRTDGINDHFSFRSLETGTNYNYSVLASDSSGVTVTLIDSYFNIGASAPAITKPEMPIVSVSSSQYAVGDSITISWTEAARNEYYWINVFKDGSLIVDQSMGTSLSYTLTNAQAGSYLVYVSANNSAGTSGSSNCTFSVNSGSEPIVLPTGTVSEKLATILAEYPDGSSWTDTFDGSKKSYGFAGLVIYKIFGNSTVAGKTYRWWTYAGVSTSGMQAIGEVGSCTVDSVRSLLASARPGDILQFDQGASEGTQFSMIVYSVTDSGANIYDCNYYGDSIIRLHHFNYSDFVTLQASGPKGKLTLLRSDNYDLIEPPVQTTSFDLNGCLDGNSEWGSLEGYGTVDVYINGNLVAQNVGDYYEVLPVGTTYEIKNIQALDGHVYLGVHSGALSGTIGTEQVNIVLSFNTLTYLNLDGFLDGVRNDDLGQYGTADIYINGSCVGSGWNDYWASWHYGSTYEIKNIRANDGYRYNGVYSGSLTGTIGKDRLDVVLSFSTVHTFAFDPNGGSGTMPPIHVAIDDPVVFPACTFQRDGAVFLGWQAYRPIDNRYSIEYVGWRTKEEMAVAGQIPTKYPAQLSFSFNSTWTEGTVGPITIILSPAWATPDFVFPDAMTTIGNEAFAGGVFTYVKLPENAVSIGWHAFADCPNLAYIYIPALTTQIDEQAFGDLQRLTILGKAGSTAETYAQNHNYSFIAVP